MYYWDSTNAQRREVYSKSLILGDNSSPWFRDTTSLAVYGGGFEFPAPNPADRMDSIEISFEVFDFNDPKFKQALYIDELELTYASAAIADHKLAEGKLYPNPTTGWVYLDFQRPAYRGIEVLDLQGKVVHKTNASGTSIRLELNDLLPGMYLVRCTSDEGMSLHKLVKH
jgi:hypothetical protein